MEWLNQINDISLSGNHPRVPDLDLVQCSTLNSGSNATTVVPITEVAPEQFLCEYKTHCFPLCMCCDFFACDCRMQCPEGCSCFHDSTWSANVIQCSERNHTEVPLLIPMDATEIRLDGNGLGHLDTQSFIGRRRVTRLFANSSGITSISRHSFSGLVSLEFLHLEDNQLKEITGREFESLGTSLRELFLQDNDLVHIRASAFDHLTSLEVLRLDGNLLTTYPVWNLAISHPKLALLDLSGNMWSCECDFSVPLAQFLLAHELKVPDSGSVQCVSGDLEARPVLEMTVCSGGSNNNALLRLNPNGDVETVSSSDGLPTFVPIVISCALAVIVILVLFLAACVFRKRIKDWLYNKSSEIYESRCGSVHSANSTAYYSQQQQNRLFDVYISYSTKDSEFVDQSLAPTLEHGDTSYKLCLHQRDFPPSASLYDTVSVATESSSRVLVVMSRAYLESEWDHVKIPLRNSLSRDTNKLIFLVLEDLKDEDFRGHLELKQYLKQCASVRWGSHGFMNKLRFFLPEPAFLTFQRNVTLRTLQPPVHKSSSMVQVDSGVWTYALGGGVGGANNTQSSPVGSVSTQSTDDHNSSVNNNGSSRYLSSGHPATGLHHHHHQAPSVISSIYSHHTYQSIPEQHAHQHIYHTLEPSLLQQRMLKLPQAASIQEVAAAVPVNAVYINRNLDLVMKSPDEIDEDPTAAELAARLSPSTADGGGSEERSVSSKIPHAAAANTSSSSFDDDDDEEDDPPPSHHSHTQSSLSAQQLIPSSSSTKPCSAENATRGSEEYIV